MIQVIIISSFAAIVSIIVQASFVFKEKVISRRFFASLILIIPCLFGSCGNQVSTYAKINFGDILSTVVWAAIFSALVILVNVRAAKQLKNTKINPQIRTSRWPLSLFVMNSLSWIIYLISYEFLFRGYLFTSLLKHTTVENTFIVSITLYALAHLHKDEKEFLLSVPFGFILCYITLLTENVWASVIIHCALAISNDVFAFRANPFFSVSFPVYKKFDMKNKYFVLITGSSSGIGKALAYEFARRKYNILLVALPNTGTYDVASDLMKKFTVNTAVLELDLTQPESPHQIFAWCKNNCYDVQVLVNNAGFGNLCPLEETDALLVTRMLALNNHALVALTQLFISHLKTYNDSYILNVGSLASFIPIPNKAVYTASKSFVYTFSAALRLELRHLHIHVSCLCPGGTITSQEVTSPRQEMSRAFPGLAQRPEEVAKEAISELFKKKEKIIPGWHNKGIYYLAAALPAFLRSWILLKLFSIKKRKGNSLTRVKQPPTAAFPVTFR
jgi:uncharacterized protein